MALSRVLEPEVMDTLEEATDYDTMDHSTVNQIFVSDLLAASEEQQAKLTDAAPLWFADGVESCEVVDLGTGTAQIPVELCRQHAGCRVLAADLSINMLDLARLNVEIAGMIDRIALQHLDAKEMPLDDDICDVVISNSIVHHIPEPSSVIQEAWRVVRSPGLIFFRDLLRPEDQNSLQELVQMYAGQENEHQQKMFADSLHAALTLAEVREMVNSLGADSRVFASSDRHWTWVALKQ